MLAVLQELERKISKEKVGATVVDCLQVPQRLRFCSLTVQCAQKNSHKKALINARARGKNLEPTSVLLRHKINKKTCRKLGFVVLALPRPTI